MHAGLGILMVDADVALTRALGRALALRGWTVRTATSGEEALRAVESQESDVITIDMQVPDTDGWSLLAELCLHRDRSAVVLLSDDIDVDSAVRAVRMGAADVVQKPISDAELDQRLRALLRARVVSTPPPAPKPASCVAGILGESPGIRAVREQIRTVARFRDLSVLITGETGTGKELVAQAVHAASETDAPFLPINCAAIPEALFESELFGHEAGSFTGARGTRVGLFEVASTGTLFLDELGELPISLQPKLLRALESRTFRRIGGSRDIPFRARVISATHRNLLHDGSSLRKDLYYRLAGFTIATPSLRDAISDVDLLARHFLSEFSARYHLSVEFSPRALEALHAHDWPGNVRELRAVVQQAAVLAEDGWIGVAELAAAFRDRQDRTKQDAAEALVSAATMVRKTEPLRDLERRTIHETWSSTGHNLSAAARALGLPRTTLRDRLRKYGLR